MKRLWVAAALAPLSFAASAYAQQNVSTQTSTPLFTATGGDITIAAGGSIQLKSANQTAATLNSNNSVANAGSITARDLNNVNGIQALGGFTGNITNSGTIQLDESATQHTNGTNGIADGVFVNGAFASNFALGTNRIGILVSGASQLTGAVTNSGPITVVGETSAGISIVPGISGALADSGAINVTGDNSFGIHAVGQIGGDVTVTAAISATGQNTVGLALDGGSKGKVEIGSSIAVTGFHSQTPPITTNQINALEASQLEPGGPAVTIGGSVATGISIDAPTAAVAASGSTAAVAATPGGSISASGSTALVIGGPNPITIGALASGPSLFVGGPVASAGIYQNFNATAIQIGSSSGAATALPGGIDITSTVSATTVATNLAAKDGAGNSISGTAIGLHLMSGANVSSITVGAPLTIGGGLTASSSSSVANTVTALQIDSGAARPPGGITVTNSGTIAAAIGGIGAVLGGPPAAGGTLGTATAISDQAGAIGAITNTGAISASITPIVSSQTVASSAKTVALDLSANTAGVTVTQSQAATIPATSTVAAVTPGAPSITGDVLFGSGNANLNLLAGTLTGAVSFGGGANTLDVENGAVATGALSEAAGGQLGVTIGTNGVNTATSTLNMTAANKIGVSSLNVGASGQVIFTVDPANGAGSQLAVSGNTALATGAKIGLNIVSADPNVQTFSLITTAGTFTSGAPVSSLLGQTPFLFNASLSEPAAGTVAVTVSQRTAAQLGLNAAETSAYTAFFDQLKGTAQDAPVTTDVLSKTNRSDFIHLYDQFLPDFAGGPFDSQVVAQGQIAQAQADQPIKLQTDGARGWVQEIGYLDNRQDTASANGYRAGGFGIIGGIEQARGDSAVGLSAAFVTSGVKNDRQGPGGELSTAGVEAGAYWRDGTGGEGLNLHASVNGGYLFLSNHRLLFDENNAGTVSLFREAKSQWNGATVSFEVGANFQVPIGRFYIRPEVIADYVYLYESAFTEHGGGVAVDLGVAARSSEEGTVQGDLVMGADLGGVNHWRPELTLGWREVVTGGPGDTTAHFLSGGPSFKLSPVFNDKGSLIARVGLHAGGNFADFSADAGGQLNNNYQVYNARAVARFLF